MGVAATLPELSEWTLCYSTLNISAGKKSGKYDGQERS